MPQLQRNRVSGMSGADMLAAWLAEGIDHIVMGIERWPIIGWRCKIYDGGVDKFKGTGPTPDAAMKAAVEAARKA